MNDDLAREMNDNFRDELVRDAVAVVTAAAEQVARAREKLQQIEAFVKFTVKAKEMPLAGGLFVRPGGVADFKKYPNEGFQDHQGVALICMVIDPAFGYCIRFTVEEDYYHLICRARYRGDRDYEIDLKKGTLLEFLAVGAPPSNLAPGGDFDLTCGEGEDVVLRRAYMNSHELAYNDEYVSRRGRGRIVGWSTTANNKWTSGGTCIDTYQNPPTEDGEGWNGAIKGRVVSIEPRCSAYTCLPKGVETLKDAADFPPKNTPYETGVNYIVTCTLREVYLMTSPEGKSAALRK